MVWISGTSLFHKVKVITVVKFCDPSFFNHDTAIDAFIEQLCHFHLHGHTCNAYLIFWHTYSLPSYTSAHSQMALSLLRCIKFKQQLDIYCPLLAMVPTNNSISLSFYFPCLCLTTSLVPIHSCTVNDCYNALYPPLKFVPWIREHPVHLQTIFICSISLVWFFF